MLFVKVVVKRKDMELTAKVNKEQWVSNYINIFNGGLRITQKEKDLLAEYLLIYVDLIKDGLKEPYLSKLVFAKENVAEIRKKLNLSSQSYNNYKTQLKDKGVLKEDNGLKVDPKLIPQKELTFKFIVE